MRIAGLTLLGLLVAGTLYAAGTYVMGSEEGAAATEIESQAEAAQKVMATEIESQAEAAQEAAAIQPVSAPPGEEEPAGSVARAIVTTEIMDREPVDSIDTLSNDHNQVFFFTELENLSGQTITHRWEYAGEIMADVPLEIGAARWRTYSSKRLHQGWLGEWKVSVIDEEGRELSSATFTYIGTTAGAEPPAAMDEE
jgi:hypothetical protein